MKNLQRTLESGAELEVSMGTFAESYALLKAVLKELEGVNLDLGIKSSEGLKGLLPSNFGPQALNTLKNLIARMIYSPTVELALWPCLQRATYDNVRLTDKALFDENEKMRGDYLTIVKEVVWFNLSPFFKNLSSLSSMVPKEVSGSQSSNS